MAADVRAAYLAHLRAGDKTFSPQGLEYLFHLIFRASYHGKTFRHLPAAELCRIFRQQAGTDFGAFAGETMQRFGFHVFADLGRAIFLLADQGLLTLMEGETQEAYAALGLITFGGNPDA